MAAMSAPSVPSCGSSTPMSASTPPAATSTSEPGERESAREREMGTTRRRWRRQGRRAPRRRPRCGHGRAAASAPDLGRESRERAQDAAVVCGRPPHPQVRVPREGEKPNPKPPARRKGSSVRRRHDDAETARHCATAATAIRRGRHDGGEQSVAGTCDGNYEHPQQRSGRRGRHNGDGTHPESSREIRLCFEGGGDGAHAPPTRPPLSWRLVLPSGRAASAVSVASAPVSPSVHAACIVR
jgi:hypothetical protein